MAIGEGRRPALTRREREIAALVANGLTNRQIAGRLFISERTADAHLEHIREKLGVNSRAQIAAWFAERGTTPEGVDAPLLTPRLIRWPTTRMAAAIALFTLLLLVVAGLSLSKVFGPASSRAPMLSTLAGNSPFNTYAGGYSGDFGPASAAQLSHPMAVAVSHQAVYIADSFNHVIRKVDGKGVITTIAGGGSLPFVDGANATSVALPQLNGLAVGHDGSVFICGGSSVFRIDSDATIHLLSLPVSSPPLQDAYALAIDGAGDLYIADRAGNSVRELSAGGRFTTYAGTGQSGFSGDGGAATGARLSFPAGLSLDSHGDLFIADQGNNRIRRVDHDSGIITTVAGSNDLFGFAGDEGLATLARLSLPAGIAMDNGSLYIADTGNNRIREVSPAGVITTLAGGLFGPWGLAIDSTGALLVADSGNNRVREIHPMDGNR